MTNKIMLPLIYPVPIYSLNGQVLGIDVSQIFCEPANMYASIWNRSPLPVGRQVNNNYNNYLNYVKPI